MFGLIVARLGGLRMAQRRVAFARTFASKGEKIPIAYLKNENDPEIMDDSEYPEWLFTLLDEMNEKPSLEKEGLTWENGGKRFYKLENRKRIKANNLNADAL